MSDAGQQLKSEAYYKRHRNKATKNKHQYEISNPVLTKQCKTCNNILDIDKFHYHSDFTQDGKLCGDGHMNECKLCHASRTSNNKRLKAFGITRVEYEDMLNKQNGVCAICGNVNNDGSELYVDHDHLSGDIRKLLCSPCNLGLGNFRDSISNLEKAIQYLRGFG